MSNYTGTKILFFLLILTLNAAEGKNFFKNFKPIRRKFSEIKKSIKAPINRMIEPIKTKILEPMGRLLEKLMKPLGDNHKFPLWLKEQDLEKAWDPNGKEDEGMEQKVVRLHNEVRKNYAVPPLKWDANLASLAEKAAGKCSGAYDYALNPGQLKYGQNIYAVVNAKANALAAVRTWERSGVNYDSEGRRCDEDKNCYPFMQMIWPNSTRIGCYLSLCERLRPTTEAGSFFVCFYAPL